MPPCRSSLPFAMDPVLTPKRAKQTGIFFEPYFFPYALRMVRLGIPAPCPNGPPVVAAWLIQQSSLGVERSLPAEGGSEARAGVQVGVVRRPI